VWLVEISVRVVKLKPVILITIDKCSKKKVEKRPFSSLTVQHSTISSKVMIES